MVYLLNYGMLIKCSYWLRLKSTARVSEIAEQFKNELHKIG